MSELKEPLILSIETATRAGSVALVRGKEVLGSGSGDPVASHSTDLIQTVAGILQNAGLELSEIELFAAAVGPGSFTGLRIGLATIKSFAMCTGVSCAGVSTLGAIAHAAGTSESTVSLLPAGRGELFAQMFSVSDGQVRELDTPAHLSPDAILERYGGMDRLRWAGEGAHQHAEKLRDWARLRNKIFTGPGADPGEWSLAQPVAQLAVSIASLALNAYRSGHTVSPNDLRAVYVRASDAEINEKMATRELVSSGSGLSLARMTEHDLLEVVEIEELSGISAWGWSAYHKELQSPEDVIMLVARFGTSAPTEIQGHAIAGFIVSRLVADELHINNVAVRPELRRHGIAAQLLAEVLKQGRSSNARLAFLEVREGNLAAQGLYQRSGFKVTGRRRRYYNRPVEDALLMSLLLEI
jgi:tRNA threonylcarbamoyladenosine biosynthesis protein TsaB